MVISPLPSSAAADSTLAQQALDIGVYAGPVIAHRLFRLALAGAHPSARDRREFATMVWEKPEAFVQGWAAASVLAWQMQQQLTTAWFRWWLTAAPAHRDGARAGLDGSAPGAARTAVTPPALTLSAADAKALASAALRPTVARVKQNARRLTRTRRLR